MTVVPEALGIIAGNGRYPVLLAEAARARGVKRLVVVGFSGETAPEMEALADAYTRLRVGQLGALCSLFSGAEGFAGDHGGADCAGEPVRFAAGYQGGAAVGEVEGAECGVDFRGDCG